MIVAQRAVEQLGLARDTFAGEVAVITGAGRGLGRAVAMAFAWLGARVVAAEAADGGSDMEQLIREADGQAIFVRADVSSETDVEHLSARTVQVFGPASILINSAAISPDVPLVDMDVALWDRVVAVNLRGAFLTCHAFLPGMLAARRGTILNLAPPGAMPGRAAYTVANTGLAGLSQALAAEVAESGIRVIAFSPGIVDNAGSREPAGAVAGTGLSADQAAAAAAYLVARLGDECQGAVMTASSVLDRARLAAAASGPASSAWTAPDGDPLVAAIELSNKLQVLLAETEADFGRLPVFVRPMARGGFKAKAGQGIQDWARTASNLTDQLGRLAAGDAQAAACFRAGHPRLSELLLKLIDYCQDVPGETTRFTKDHQLLAAVSQAMVEREAILRALIRALDAVSRL